MSAISNTDDIIDSRDVIEAIEDYEFKATHPDNPDDMDMSRLDEDEREHYEMLVKFRDENEHMADWHHGAMFIRDSYFTDYVRELLQDIGDLPNGIPGYIVIDWEETADNVQVDYTDTELDGETYWVRA